MTPECHRLAERLQHARLLKRWSEVLSVAEQLSRMNACRSHSVAGRPSEACGMPGERAKPGMRIDNGAARMANGFETGEAPAILPLRPKPATQTATWLQKWWAMAFPAANTKKAEAVSDAKERSRFLLWVDAVGGYLVCTGDELVLGQPVPGSDVDIPIRGDLSRRHAVIHRDGEGYLLEPVREVKLNGKVLERATSLNDRDRITLGDSVQLCFRRPHPLSLTARLEFLSHHRTQPATDGVLLMAESCILGPATSSHVVCPGWPHDVLLTRQGATLGCRSSKPFRIDGSEHREKGQLAERSQVAGQDFSFSVEPA
jgi:hypothetical protein